MNDSFENSAITQLQDIKNKWVIAVVLKCLFCVLSLQIILNLPGWKFVLIGFLPLLGRFAVIGFLFPLCVMVWYLWYGYKKVKVCTDLRKIVGDSAYFLGFLFTIASIIAAMGDMALTNMQDGTMTYVASRFALAMITTLLGMTYRTWLTEFNINDTVPDNKEACSIAEGEDKKREQKNNDTGAKGKKNLSQIQPLRNLSTRQDEEYAVSLVIKAISDDEVFKQLQNTMNQAIHSFNEMATNAVNVKGKLEAAAQVIAEGTGEHLKMAVTKVVEEASKSIVDSIGKTVETNNKLLDQNKDRWEEYFNDQQKIMQEVVSSVEPMFRDVVQKVMNEHQASLLAVEDITQKHKRSIDTMSEALSTATDELQLRINDLKNIYKSWNDETKMMSANVKKRSDGLDKAFNNLSDVLQGVGDSFNKHQTGVANELVLVDNNVEKLKEISATLNNSASVYSDVRVQLDSMLNDLVAMENKYVFVREKFEDSLTKTVSAIDGLPEMCAKFGNAATQLSSNMGYLNDGLVQTNKTIAGVAEHYSQAKGVIKSDKSWWRFW